MTEAHWQFEEVAPLHAARTSQRDVPTTLNTYTANQRIVGEEMARRGWGQAELEQRRKADAEKIKITRGLRAETTMTWGWITERLAMGTSGYTADCLRKAACSQDMRPVGLTGFPFPICGTDPFLTPSTVARRAVAFAEPLNTTGGTPAERLAERRRNARATHLRSVRAFAAKESVSSRVRDEPGKKGSELRLKLFKNSLRSLTAAVVAQRKEACFMDSVRMDSTVQQLEISR